MPRGDKTGDISLDIEVKEYIKKKYNKPGDVFLGVVHRLDRPVSGVVLFARTTKALARLNEMFREKEMKKIYWAIVKDRPPEEEGILKNYLKKNEAQNKAYAYDFEVKGSKEATLSYKLLARAEKYYLLEIELHSGRHHQIRVQLAKAGCPIKGDLKYGFPRSNENGGISLLARKIEFIHPVSKENIVVVAPVPKGDIWGIFTEALKK